MLALPICLGHFPGCTAVAANRVITIFPRLFLPQSRATDRRRSPLCGCLLLDQYLPSPRPSGWSLVTIGPGNQSRANCFREVAFSGARTVAERERRHGN
jgi:hypothetical protein